MNPQIENYSKANEPEVINCELERISNNLSEYDSVETYKKIFSLIDFTSLNVDDTEEKIREMVQKVNLFKKRFPEMPNVAAICVYPSFVEAVKDSLEIETINIASVAGGFPSSQTFISVKVSETKVCVEKGADEIDIVIPVGKMIKGDIQSVADNIAIIKQTCGENVHLKTILEASVIDDGNTLKRTAFLAMHSGADFIKTSTGKDGSIARLKDVFVMAHAIKEYYEKTGNKVGIKPAGGISTPEEALKYYALISDILGEEWLTPKLFRIGASRLANNLLEKIYTNSKDVKYF